MPRKRNKVSAPTPQMIDNLRGLYRELGARGREREAAIVEPPAPNMPQEQAIPCCGTCKYFQKPVDVNFGQCRRRAPGPGGFALVGPSVWCGDYEKREG